MQWHVCSNKYSSKLLLVHECKSMKLVYEPERHARTLHESICYAKGTPYPHVPARASHCRRPIRPLFVVDATDSSNYFSVQAARRASWPIADLSCSA